jgi:hypothetical protein
MVLSMRSWPKYSGVRNCAMAYTTTNIQAFRDMEECRFAAVYFLLELAASKFRVDYSPSLRELPSRKHSPPTFQSKSRLKSINTTVRISNIVTAGDVSTVEFM